MAIALGIVALLLAGTGLLSLVSLRGRLSQNGALLALFYLFQMVMFGSFDLVGAFNRTTGGPLHLSRSAGWLMAGWLVVSLLAARLLSAVSLRLAELLLRRGVRPGIPPERPIARLVRSLGGQPAEEIVRRVQERYVVPAGLVEELIQQMR